MYIYSKWAERDLRSLDRHNCVAKLYELIGIYTSYQGDATIAKSMSFAQYYEECTDEKRYHFKNIGERQVKACLPFVPRRDFRLLSRTYGGIPVISSSTMGNIFTELQRIVLENETMREIYLGKIKRSTLDEFLEFQYAFVSLLANVYRQEPKTLIKVVKGLSDNQLDYIAKGIAYDILNNGNYKPDPSLNHDNEFVARIETAIADDNNKSLSAFDS